MKELELIRRLRAASPAGGRVLVGIGDDAAVVSVPGGRAVVTTDLVIEGTHFLPGTDPVRIGRKALAVSLSDVAAMGCRATAAFLAVGLRRDLPDGFDLAIHEGARGIAAEFGVPLAGGDTTETRGPLVLCSTVLGEPSPGRDPVLRSGARPGHALLVTGALGGSLAGRHLDFRPRLREAAALVGTFHPGGMLDVSDGLSTDARHLAMESGVSVEIRAAWLPIAPGSDLAGALDDGEDFELLFSLPEEEAAAVAAGGLAGTPVTRVGTIGEGPARVTLVRPDGSVEELRAGGYEHFR